MNNSSVLNGRASINDIRYLSNNIDYASTPHSSGHTDINPIAQVFQRYQNMIGNVRNDLSTVFDNYDLKGVTKNLYGKGKSLYDQIGNFADYLGKHVAGSKQPSQIQIGSSQLEQTTRSLSSNYSTVPQITTNYGMQSNYR